MENIIARLLGDFENGRMTRRQLIQSLALAATAASGASAAVASVPAAGGFKTISVDHISYQVSDYARTRDFYADLLGMTVANDNGTNSCELQFGESVLISRTRRQRPGEAADGSHGLQDRRLGHRYRKGRTGTPRDDPPGLTASLGRTTSVSTSRTRMGTMSRSPAT